MTRATARAGALLAGLLACACGRSGGAGAGGERSTVPLPDLEGVDPDVVEALTAARAAVLQQPGSGTAWGDLGDRFFVQGFLDAAASCYAEAEALDADTVAWSYRLGWCQIDAHPAEAAQAFQRSLRGLDDYPPAHEAYAAALVLLGRDDEALAHFARASELDPAAPQAETGIGRIHMARGNLDAAREHLEQALARDERHTEAHTGLAQVYLALGREEDARRHAELSRTLPQMNPRADWRKLPNLPPAGARARTTLGRQLQKQGKLAEAEEQYRIALHSNPGYYFARVSLARLLVKLGKGDEGRTLLLEWQEVDPASVQRDLARLFDSAPEEDQED